MVVRSGLEPNKIPSIPLEELAYALNSDLERGLSQKNADEGLKTFGSNIIPKVRQDIFGIYIAPFMNWLISIYLIVIGILIFFATFLLTHVWGQVIQWSSVITINSVLAIVQEIRAQKKLQSLQSLSAPKSKVIRDWKIVEVPSEQLVPGDIVKLQQGDRISADARVVSVSNLRVNEAALTGESQEVEKLSNFIETGSDIPQLHKKNMVYLGTYVSAGSAKVIVTATGCDTELGKISKELEEINVGEIPLHQKVNKLAKYLGIVILIYIAISFSYNMIQLYLRNALFSNGILNVHLVSTNIVRILVTAMSVMPINIPLLTTIVLLAGVLAMAKSKVVIRDPSAVESLGRVSVVCSDKTGTITKNEMAIKWIHFPTIKSNFLLYGVTGVGYNLEGKIIAADSEENLENFLRKGSEILTGDSVIVGSETVLEYLIVSGMLNNDSSISEEEVKTDGKRQQGKVYKALGDATDASMLVLFNKSRLDERLYRSSFQDVQTFLFDSELRRTTKVCRRTQNNGYVTFVKGATEVVLKLCSLCVTAENKQASLLDENAKSAILDKIEPFASYGYRIISFAFKEFSELPMADEKQRDYFEKDLTYLGFIAIMDPPREGVSESVEEAQGAGIRPIMVTGDSLQTARSIAEQVGIATKENLSVEGSQVNSLSDEEFDRTTVFARVSPEHKGAIIDRYQKQDRVVAMTGDGVNDILAISKADVGISMGITGTDIAKETADMVVADDSFNSIVVGIREGRGLFQKIRSIIFFYVAVNLAEALAYFGSSLIPNFYLLHGWQQIYIFMTAHSIPPFALIVDRLSRDVMKEKPRDDEGIFNRRLVVALALFSLSLSLMFYLAYFGTLNGIIPLFEENKMGFSPTFDPNNPLSPVNWAQAKARTMLHTIAFIAECALVISLRRINKPFFKILREDNYWIIWPFILLVPATHLILMYIPMTQLILQNSFLAINLEVIRLTLFDWIICIAMGLLPITLLESYKVWVKKCGHQI